MVVHFRQSVEEVSNIVLLNFPFKKCIFDFYSIYHSKKIFAVYYVPWMKSQFTNKPT